MEDREIVALYWQRSEEAIQATDAKYGPYCHTIARRVVGNDEDARECVNDAFLDAWNAIPPHCPAVLRTFLGKLTRRVSIDRWRAAQARKRGGGELTLALEELGECVQGSETAETHLERREMEDLMAAFLQTLSPVQRHVFLRRYWFLDSVPQIAQANRFTQAKVTSMLHRARQKLRRILEEEGYL